MSASSGPGGNRSASPPCSGPQRGPVRPRNAQEPSRKMCSTLPPPQQTGTPTISPQPGHRLCSTSLVLLHGDRLRREPPVGSTQYGARQPAPAVRHHHACKRCYYYTCFSGTCQISGRGDSHAHPPDTCHRGGASRCPIRWVGGAATPRTVLQPYKDYTPPKKGCQVP